MTTGTQQREKISQKVKVEKYYLGTNLISALADLNMDDFTHLESREDEYCDKRENSALECLRFDSCEERNGRFIYSRLLDSLRNATMTNFAYKRRVSEPNNFIQLHNTGLKHNLRFFLIVII